MAALSPETRGWNNSGEQGFPSGEEVGLTAMDRPGDDFQHPAHWACGSTRTVMPTLPR
jgi:hypothetical protein